MNLTATFLLKRLTAADFATIEEISPSIFRFSRRIPKADASYAVCYLDFSTDLPATRELLLSYQDRLIGQRYFEGPKSLQWNTYLYFITSAAQLATPSGQQAKELIERDRTYARKLVLAEEEVETLLNPLGPDAVITAAPSADVLSLWTNKLIQAGLYEAVFDFGDNQTPARLNHIESAAPPTANRLAVPKPGKQAPAAQFLRSLRLENYRPHPTQQEFEFGKVNLIVGANGSGKTSLLEAIELFYCGTHNREDDKPAAYQLSATWADGHPISVSHKRKPQEFRDHNLAWYGQHEVKTNNLYQSFGRFNFLNTDAAVSLATSTERIEDDLSKLLVGAEASKTWRVIQGLHQAVNGRVRELQAESDQATEQLDLLAEPPVGSTTILPASAGLYARLQELAGRFNWRVDQAPEALPMSKQAAELAELALLLKQVIDLKWLTAPVTAAELARFGAETRALLQQVEPALAQWQNAVLPEQARLARGLAAQSRALLLAQQLQRGIETELHRYTAEREQQQASLDTYIVWLADMVLSPLSLPEEGHVTLSVLKYRELLASRAALAHNEAVSAQQEYDQFSALRKQSLNLAQQLRQLATTILQHSPAPDECPLCHTGFEPGDLTKRMALGLDGQLEAAGQTLLERVQSKSGAAQVTTAAEQAAEWVAAFSERAGLPSSVSVQKALQHVKATHRAILESQVELQKLDKKIAALAAKGITFAELQKVAFQLRALHYAVELSLPAVQKVVQEIEQAIDDSNAQLSANEKVERQLASLVARSFGQDGELEAYADQVAEKKEQASVTESLQLKLAAFLQRFPWPVQNSLSKLSVEVELFIQLATEWQKARSEEEQTRLVAAKNNKRKETLQERIRLITPRLQRFVAALAVLEDLLKNHSLAAATEAALQDNRAGIDAIFKRIHAPNEFGILKGLGDASKAIQLIRKSTDTGVSLNQISTGQRAAFALSVFLAQNARLKAAAPPVILIDDPIAHVDDLNALTFIDYLREIVLASKRQLFFATSDEKLACLIERKFDFLGTAEFRRFDLVR